MILEAAVLVLSRRDNTARSDTGFDLVVLLHVAMSLNTRIFLMPFSISCEYPLLFDPPFGSYFNESDCFLLVYRACSHGQWRVLIVASYSSILMAIYGYHIIVLCPEQDLNLGQCRLPSY